jgi:hypothetical protein
MRVLLRNRKTGLYCTNSNAWAATASQALDFASVPQATRFALDGNLPETEIVLKSDLLPDEVVVPLLSEWCDLNWLREGLGTPAWPRFQPDPENGALRAVES